MRRFIDWDHISDDEIRIIGDRKSTKTHRSRWVIILYLLLILISLIALIIYLVNSNQTTIDSERQLLFKQSSEQLSEASCQVYYNELGNKTPGFCELRDTTINGIDLQIFIPHNARATLHKGKFDKADSTIVYISMAAEVRADNGTILGAYVLRGEPLAWGLSKKGYCAIIDDVVTVGVADNSPLFERATETEGYFFRQYPLVDNGVLATEKTNAYNYLRALCQMDDKTFMVHSRTKVSFPDFAQALIDLGCDNAIYIVGYQAYGWAVDTAGTTHEFGTEGYFDDKVPTADNFNYIVWRSK